MMRSMFAGVSALKNHQVQMDVIGNNIANVNTVGFKTSRATFQELLSQTVRDASAPQGARGGTNPLQVGLGVQLATIAVEHTQGNLQATGNQTDLAVQGDGFFIVANGPERFYTRSGMFDVDLEGNLHAAANGLRVMGWQADQDGNIDANGAIVPITIPRTATIDPSATTEIVFGGNLDAREQGTLTYIPNPPAEIEDSNGNKAQIQFKITPTANFNEFAWEVTASAGTLTGATSGIMRLNPDGTVASQSSPGDIILNLDPAAGDIVIHPPQALDLNGGSFSWDVLDLGGNPISSGSSSGSYTPPEPRTTTIRVFDSLGNEREVITEFTKVANNTWEWVAKDESGNVVNTGGVAGTLVFDSTGALISQSGQISIPTSGGAAAMTITPNFTGLHQFGQEASAVAESQNGYRAGQLRSFSIDSRGVVNGSFSNGLTRPLAQIAVATFANAAALKKAGDTMYEVSTNSGEARIGVAGDGTNGTIAAGTLEMSNVDLSQEFTNMIVTQRGFQANSRIITAADEMLQELVNLKR